MTVSNTPPIIAGGSTVVTFTKPQRQRVNIGAKITPLIQRYYSLFLWDLDLNDVVVDKTLDPASRRPRAEYFFTTPPKQVEMSEPFTTRVISTQNGGKFIESHGSIFKEIRIQGTTGLRPSKGSPNQIPLLPAGSFENLANTINGTGLGNQVRQIPESEITGFDDIHFLRNIFRRYSDSQSRTERVVMVYRNIKDNDYWVVEPHDFKLTRDSKSPLTYNYQINMKGLAPFQGTEPTIPEDPLATLNSFQRFVSRMAEIKQNLTASFLVLATQVSRIRGAGYFVINNTIGTLTSVIKGIDAVFSGVNSVKDSLIRNANQAVEEFDSAIESLQNTFEESAAGAGPVVGVRNRDPVIREMRNVVRMMFRILTEPSLRTSVSETADGVRARARNAYRRGGVGASSSPRTGGDPTYVGNSSTPTTVAEGRVGTGETIRDLAKRYLGDFRRWHELVLLNDLRAPYTSDDATLRPGVLTPGDSFLYPSVSGAADPNSLNPANSSGTEQDGDSDNPDSLVSQTYGRDIRLRSVQSASDVDFTDFAVNQNGDIATIVGVPNVQQAVRIRFLTEQGQLAMHPLFGARFPIGSKATEFSFNTFQVNTLSTMQSDNRIESVADLEFNAVGDTLFVTGKLLLKDSQDYVATDFALRRF